MTQQQLACFLEIARCNSFSTAAARLYYSQPTLSRQISMLEEELGIPLFVRSQNTVFLTAQAEAILPDMEKLYRDFQATEKAIHAKILNFTDHLYIGIQEPQMLDQRMEDLLHRYKQLYPRTEIRLQSLDIRRSGDALTHKEVDCLLFLGSTLPESSLLETQTIRIDEMCLAVPASHPNADLAWLTYDQVSRYFSDLPLVFMDINHFGPPPDSHLKEVREELVPEGAHFMSDEENQMNTLRLMVEHGFAISVFNEHSQLAENSNVKLLPLITERDGEIIHHYSELGFAWLRSNQNPALNEFLTLLKTEYASHCPEEESI